jgi:putative transposase
LKKRLTEAEQDQGGIEKFAESKMVGPQVKRQAVDALREGHSLGITRACGLVGISRSLYRYRSRRPDCARLRERIRELAGEKRRYGYRRIHVLLRREGWTVNRKCTYRLYREAGLAVRRRKRKRLGLFERKPLPKPAMVNRSWSMDFIADGLARWSKTALLDDRG